MKVAVPTLRACAALLTSVAPAALLFSGPVQAADEIPKTETAPAPTVDMDRVVVTGIRGSLERSTELKRNASQILDAVSAEDVGKFPDQNIADSLQRITGVAIDRNGGEGQFITVRGLGPEFNTVLVNGRIMATDNDGREFSFDVLASSLIQRAEVYKSSTPNLQEGGIGATVNIVTAKPLDGQSGLHATLSAAAGYDKLRKSTSPDLSGIVSYRNADRTFGALLSGSFSDRKTQNDFVQTDGWIQGPQQVINGTADSMGLPATSAVLGTSPVNTSVPQNFNVVRQEGRKKRLNLAGSIQTKPNDKVLVTLDGLYSKLDSTTTDRFFGAFYSAPFINLKTDANGTATSFNRPGVQFLNNNPDLTDPSLGGRQVTLSQNDNVVNYNERNAASYQLGANAKWDVSDKLKLNFDISKTQATRSSPRAFVVVGSQAQTAPSYDLNVGQDLPVIGNLGPITDASLMRAHYIGAGLTKVKDAGSEYHVDGDYRIEDGALNRLQVGGSYSEREKTSKSRSSYDCAYCGYHVVIPANLITPYTLNNYLPGASGSGQLPKQFFTFDPYAIMGYLSQPSVIMDPAQGRSNAETQGFLTRPGGPFGLRDQPESYSGVKEKVSALYVNSVWEGEAWEANVGARYVSTRTISSGFATPLTSVTLTPGDDTLNISYGPSTPVSVGNHYSTFLPSANFKYDLAADSVLRAAISKTITRPTLTSLGTSNFYGGRVTGANSGGGNPGLKPFESTNYDLSYEKYLSKASYVSVSGFYKSFRNFLEEQTLPLPIANVTNGFDNNTKNVVFQDRRTRNGEKGSITGLEIGGQYAFDQNDGLLSGFGVSGNYTYVTSKVQRAAGSPAADCGYNGLSPHSANGSVFYEKSGLSVRMSYNWRSSFLRSCFSDASRPENRKAYGQMDFSVGYDLDKNFQVFLQGVNVLNAYIYDYSVYEERFKRVQNTGSRFNIGVRAKF